MGTQTQIMEQILSQEGHFVLMVKKNQPQSYDEIVKYFGEMSEDYKKMQEDKNYKPRYPEMQENMKKSARRKGTVTGRNTGGTVYVGKTGF